MLNLTRAIDRATDYVFVPPSDAQVPAGGAVPDPAAAGSARTPVERDGPVRRAPQ